MTNSDASPLKTKKRRRNAKAKGEASEKKPIPRDDQGNPNDNRHFLIGLGRAAAGAIIFSLPLLMTMEMWDLGFTIEHWKMVLLIVIAIPLLIGLSHVFGFEDTFGWQDDTLDAFVALAVGAVSSGVILLIIGILTRRMELDEIIGKIELQMIPGSIGALLAQSQLGSKKQQRERTTRYGSEIFLMAVGSLFLSISIAPTEEIVLIAARLSKWQGVQLCLISIILMHAFVYVVDFRGTEKASVPVSSTSIFLRFTIVGYALALMVGTFVLWSVGRTKGLDISERAMIIVVLGFPSAVGAAAARLII